MEFVAAVGGTVVGIREETKSGRWQQFARFLILGTGNGVYYAGERNLTTTQAEPVSDCLVEDGQRVVAAIGEMARSGRVPSHNPILLALAMAASPKYADAATNTAALDALPEVARTALHLKKFVNYVAAERGWGRSLRSAIGRWYVEKPARELARQMLKQRKRGRWSHADLLRLAHPKPSSKAHNALFRWAVEGELGRLDPELREGELRQLYGFEAAKHAVDKHEIIGLIEDYQLTHEMVPAEWLSAPEVWEALLEGMPFCTLLRNLHQLTAAGVITPQGETTALVAARLADRHRIARAKASPVTVLAALMEYRRTNGVPAIATALEAAYHLSLEAATPLEARTLTMLDAGSPVSSTVIGMLMARSEGATIHPTVSRADRLEQVTAAVAAHNGGIGFDRQSGTEAFLCLAGDGAMLPALRRYRAETGIAARLVVIAENAVQPPLGAVDDPGVLQVVGFDASVPAVVAEFLRSAD
jgi:60 kDa SS-A/Ro ribonucleoprotein